jgi:anti-sigma factor (TIGR02949 family)
MSDTTCRGFAKCLDAYVDGELEPSQMLSMQTHVEQCVGCSERVLIERVLRDSLRQQVRSAQAPNSLRMRVAGALAEVGDQQSEQTDVVALPPRMLSWRVVGPMAAAAVLALVLGSMSRNTADPRAQSSSIGSASVMSLDTFMDELVDQHAHPLPPETTNPVDMAGFDRFVGVPVHAQVLNRNQGTLIGARMVPVRHSRAAMLQYMLTNGHRVSVYVYNPTQVRMTASPRLREQVIGNSPPVYVGWVRGYSVAVTDRRGVGYALASDLDEKESSQMIVSVEHAP